MGTTKINSFRAFNTMYNDHKNYTRVQIDRMLERSELNGTEERCEWKTDKNPEHKIFNILPRLHCSKCKIDSSVCVCVSRVQHFTFSAIAILYLVVEIQMVMHTKCAVYSWSLQ